MTCPRCGGSGIDSEHQGPCGECGAKPPPRVAAADFTKLEDLAHAIDESNCEAEALRRELGVDSEGEKP